MRVPQTLHGAGHAGVGSAERLEILAQALVQHRDALHRVLLVACDLLQRIGIGLAAQCRALVAEQLAHALQRGGQLADPVLQRLRAAARVAAHGSWPSVASSFSAMRSAFTW